MSQTVSKTNTYPVDQPRRRPGWLRTFHVLLVAGAPTSVYSFHAFPFLILHALCFVVSQDPVAPPRRHPLPTHTSARCELCPRTALCACNRFHPSDSHVISLTHAPCVSKLADVQPDAGRQAQPGRCRGSRGPRDSIILCVGCLTLIRGRDWRHMQAAMRTCEDGRRRSVTHRFPMIHTH